MGITSKAFFRDNLYCHDTKADRYIRAFLQQAESVFLERNAEFLAAFRNNPVMTLQPLIDEGYDAILFYRGKEIIAHEAHQEVKEEGNLLGYQNFHFFIEPEHRKKPKLTGEIMGEFVEHVRKRKTKFRLSELDPLAQRTTKFISDISGVFGVTVDDNGWICPNQEK